MGQGLGGFDGGGDAPGERYTAAEKARGTWGILYNHNRMRNGLRKGEGKGEGKKWPRKIEQQMGTGRRNVWKTGVCAPKSEPMDHTVRRGGGNALEVGGKFPQHQGNKKV